MARINLIDPDDHPSLDALAERIRGRRRGSVINLYRALMHSPQLAETWFDYVNTVRFETALDGRLRELVTIRIGHLNGCAYVLRQHVPDLAAAEGVKEAECAALAEGRDDGFSDRERAALDYAETMTREIVVPDSVFEPLRAHFTEREIVELTAMIATYNMHTRFLVALEVDLEPPATD